MTRPLSPRPQRVLRRWVIATTALAVAALFFACNQGSEGDRCNPDLIQPGGLSGVPQYKEDECHSPLTCQTPPTCAISVCCPTHPPYDDPDCACLANPTAGCACTVAALVDAGADGAPSEASVTDAQGLASDAQGGDK